MDAPLVPDASPIDASVCPCPGTEPLSRQHLIDDWEFGTMGNTNAHVAACPMTTDLPIGGACLLSDLTEVSGLVGSTREGNGILGFAYWGCIHSTFAFGHIDVAARCVRPLDRTGEIPEGCTCPPFETPRDRIFYVQQATTIPAGEITDVAPTCPAGSTLLSGSCDLDSGAALIGHGSYAEDQQSWHCSWYGLGGVLEGQAAAICLNPPGPDAVTGEPVAPEIIEHVYAEDMIPANGTRIVDATCAPGDTLLAGGCQVADLSADLDGLILKRVGMAKPEDNRPNTWQCAWRNPTPTSPKVFAMATCLKPAAPTTE
ncbi:MAG TPA: hypothetical protein VNM90_27410 [Haliangium sp.]|nr:hypothetical protein [Haliangium sp.]